DGRSAQQRNHFRYAVPVCAEGIGDAGCAVPDSIDYGQQRDAARRRGLDQLGEYRCRQQLDLYSLVWTAQRERDLPAFRPALERETLRHESDRQVLCTGWI